MPVSARALPALTCLVAVATGGCVDPVVRGAALFTDKRTAGSSANQLTCALCHDVAPARADSPGHALAGVTRRPSFWGGALADLHAAIDRCVVSFMGGRGLDASAEDTRALVAYLEDASRPERTAPGLEAAQAWTLVDPVTAADVASLPAGDAERGALRWTSACRPCHGEVATGRGRITSETSVVPVALLNDPEIAAKRLYVVERIRRGRSIETDRMPPFSPERLDDQAVADLLRFLERHGLPPS